MMADGLQPRATGILGMIGQLLNQGRQPSGAVTYPFVPPERIPESLPMPLMGVDRNMPAQTAPEAPTLNPESGARALLGLGIRRPSEAGARARRALDPDYERQLPKEERRKDQGALSVLGNFLGNQEAMAQLAIAFNSMRLNPDAGLAASMQNLVERGGERRSASRTAEWLRSQGRTDLADLVEQNPALATEALKQMTGSEAPSKVREFEYAQSQGYGGSYMDFLAAQRAPGASVSVTTGPQVGTIPQGYQLTSQDGAYRMEPIPGGPAAIEAEQREAKAGKRAEQEGVRESIVGRDVDRLVNMIDRGGIFNLPEAGIIGNVLGSLGINQEAVDFRNTLAGVQATVSFDRLQQMRDASETGGALGSVTERELDLLMSAYGAIQQSTSPQMLKENLQTIKRIMNKIENDPVASSYYRGQPTSMSGQTTSTGGFSVLGRVD